MLQLTQGPLLVVQLQRVRAPKSLGRSRGVRVWGWCGERKEEERVAGVRMADWGGRCEIRVGDHSELV